MSKSFGKSVLGVSMAAALVGCGGGSDDKKDPNASIPTVDGSFVYVSETDKSYQLRVAGTEGAMACEHASRYFESENTMVYSGGTLSDNDLQRVASVAEYAMNKVIPYFGFESISEFSAQKRVITYSAISQFANTVSNMKTEGVAGLDDLSLYFKGTHPAGYTGWMDPDLAQNVIAEEFYNQLIVESDPQKVYDVLSEVATAIGVAYGNPARSDLYNEVIAENTIYPKMQICALNPLNGGASGEGVVSGFIVPSNMDVQIYLHELTHYVQQQYAPVGPRWLTEGQAVNVAGQSISSSRASHFNLIEILRFSDEQTLNINDGYGYYGLAYKALAKHNSLDSIIGFMQGYSMDLASEFPGSTLNPDFNKATAAFESLIVGRDGASITYQEFGNTYDQLAR